MDPKLAYWTAALAVMAVAVACAAAGWRAARRGAMERHRRLMNATVVLVVLFVVSYAAKVVVIGKEDLALWSRSAVVTLRVHETFVLVMVVAGTAARLLARKLWPPPSGAAATRGRHRWAGRAAIVAGLLGLLTATMILVGMYGRA